MHPLIPAFLGNVGLNAAVTRDMMRAKPVERAGGKRIKELVTAFADQSKQNAGNDDIVKIGLEATEAPTGKEILKGFESDDPMEALAPFNTLQYAGNRSDYGKAADGSLDIMQGERLPATVMFNPNADEAYFAHELGHTASTNTKHGDMIRRIRDFAGSNPATRRAIGLAAGLTPIAAGAMTPGDDDLDEAILGSIALQSPELIDEFLASKNALAIMEKSGRRASLGQRGRLAGAYLTYLGKPIMTGTVANFIGNQLDEDI